MTIRTSALRLAIGASLVTLALGGCSRSEPDTATVTENTSYEETAPVEATAPPVVEEAPAPVAPEVKADAPPAPEIAPDVQVQDDADATGMTARVRRDGTDTPTAEPDAPTANEQQPQ